MGLGHKGTGRADSERRYDGYEHGLLKKKEERKLIVDAVENCFNDFDDGLSRFISVTTVCP